jgi:hypothetical protein
MNTLLRTDGTVTPSCSKCHISYTIHLHQECRELHVEFAYSPKLLEDEARAEALIQDALPQFILEEHLGSYKEHYKDFLPLQNLLTLSFDDERGFRGAGHRHDPEQHMIIAADKASPGLIQGVFPQGQLRIMINVHCVVSEECRYQLHVWEAGEAK